MIQYKENEIKEFLSKGTGKKEYRYKNISVLKKAVDDLKQELLFRCDKKSGSVKKSL